MVRAVPCHECGTGLNPRIDVICGLSLLLALSFASRGFSPGTPVFPLFINQHYQIPILPGMVDEEPFVDVLPLNRYLLIITNKKST